MLIHSSLTHSWEILSLLLQEVSLHQCEDLEEEMMVHCQVIYCQVVQELEDYQTSQR